MLVAADKGYYADEGLSVSIDAGRGSVDAISKVASGTYEFGFADVSNLVQFAAENGEGAPIAIMMVYDEGPFSIFTMADSGIETPADMEGHSLGSPAFDASFKLFPAFAAETGIDEAAVERINMDGQLRKTMLLRGEVDMISGHYYSSYIDRLKRGAEPEDLRSFLFSDFGMDFYGNAVIVSRAFAEENPELVRGFLRATARGSHGCDLRQRRARFTHVISSPNVAIAIDRHDDVVRRPSAEPAWSLVMVLAVAALSTETRSRWLCTLSVVLVIADVAPARRHRLSDGQPSPATSALSKPELLDARPAGVLERRASSGDAMSPTDPDS